MGNDDERSDPVVEIRAQSGRVKMAKGGRAMRQQQVPLAPLKRGRSLVTKVVDDLAADIFKNRRPGERLPVVDELAAQFEVSRTVIREALSVLTAKGLLQVRQGDGTYVREPGLAEIADALSNMVRFRVRDNRTMIIDLIELRAILESTAARLAASVATGADLTAIGQTLQRARDARATGQAEQEIDAKIAFHVALGRASHNELLALIIEVIEPLVRDQHRQTQHNARPRHHDRIFKAVLGRDADAAAAASVEHTDALRGELYQQLFGDPRGSDAGANQSALPKVMDPPALP